MPEQVKKLIEASRALKDRAVELQKTSDELKADIAELDAAIERLKNFNPHPHDHYVCRVTFAGDLSSLTPRKLGFHK